ncbi:hypothetical protein EUGRSUZ_L02892 [Eucalyptus grandis]|uniref:Leucine-rich repeat-containing N-terminal plant-type domain-containing protein n=1 Tax=Eucalyptus grandis TaxID=71139 RepID=A0AAD9T8L7_EUCGR|nr:hypothetical protein EUGRSUZ_L02892 [Eucalyptus grandis]
MTSIQILNLEDNEFIDSVASSPLTSLTSLEFLSISESWISPQMTFRFPFQPSCWKTILSWKNFFMANNLFTTLKVPSMTLFNLWEMDLSNNSMRGELTTEFWANVPNLFCLDLSANRLEGSIPSQMDSNLSLERLNVAYNSLQGEIVFSDDAMNQNLSYLRLHHNMFTRNLSFLSSQGKFVHIGC